MQLKYLLPLGFSYHELKGRDYITHQSQLKRAPRQASVCTKGTPVFELSRLGERPLSVVIASIHVVHERQNAPTTLSTSILTLGSSFGCRPQIYLG